MAHSSGKWRICYRDALANKVLETIIDRVQGDDPTGTLACNVTLAFIFYDVRKHHPQIFATIWSSIEALRWQRPANRTAKIEHEHVSLGQGSGLRYEMYVCAAQTLFNDRVVDHNFSGETKFLPNAGKKAQGLGLLSIPSHIQVSCCRKKYVSKKWHDVRWIVVDLIIS